MSSMIEAPRHDTGNHDRSDLKGRQVLVIGRLPQVNRSVVEPLLELGIAAQGSTEPEVASERFDARDFELVVFGRGVLGPLSDRLKRDFAEQNPDIRFVDAIAPVAIKQTLAALARDPQDPQFLNDVRVAKEGEDIRVHAIILAPCHVTLTIFHVVGGELESAILAETNAKPGPFEQRIDASSFADANSLLLIADDEEYHLHPFLSDR